jgi:hypothetical protein
MTTPKLEVAHLQEGRITVPFAEEHARHELQGEVLATIPPRSGEPEMYRSMTRFRLGAREALGLIESRRLML